MKIKISIDFNYNIINIKLLYVNSLHFQKLGTFIYCSIVGHGQHRRLIQCTPLLMSNENSKNTFIIYSTNKHVNQNFTKINKNIILKAIF